MSTEVCAVCGGSGERSEYDLTRMLVTYPCDACKGKRCISPADPRDTTIANLRAENERLTRELSAATERADLLSDRLNTERRYHEETKGYRQHAEQRAAELEATARAALTAYDDMDRETIEPEMRALDRALGR